MDSYSFIIVSLTMLALVGHGLACSCLHLTVAEKYCKSDFVLKVSVQSDLINENGQQDFNDYYLIQILEEWKFKKKNEVSNTSRVYTASNSAMCGVYLQNGQTYLISGLVDTSEGRMEMNLCSSLIVQTPFPANIENLEDNPPICGLPNLFHSEDGVLAK